MTDVQQARIEVAAEAMLATGGDGFGVVVERDGMSLKDAYTEYARAAIAAADAVVTVEDIARVIDKAEEGTRTGSKPHRQRIVAAAVLRLLAGEAEERGLGDKCQCWPTPEHMHFNYYGAVEPGSVMEYNPDCPEHGDNDND